MNDAQPTRTALNLAIRNWLKANGYPEWFSAPTGRRVNIDDIIIAHADEFGKELRAELQQVKQERDALKRQYNVEAATAEERAEAAESRIVKLEEALKKLVSKLDRILPNVVQHGRSYTGPNLVEELAAAREALPPCVKRRRQ